MDDFFSFIEPWTGQIGTLCIGISVLLVIFYEARLLTIRKQTVKYEFASGNEVNFFIAASTIFSIGIALTFFYLVISLIGNIETFEYYFVAFVAIGIGFLFGYGLRQYFKVYYPFILEKKLSKIRFKPRKSPKSGKPMKLLNELEEDAHLTQEMIDHEEEFTYDYDVWIDEETGFKLIERYDGHLHARICPKCNFRTLKDYKETIVKSPTYSEKGQLQKHYKCSYCNHEEIKEVKIASISEEEKFVS